MVVVEEEDAAVLKQETVWLLLDLIANEILLEQPWGRSVQAVSAEMKDAVDWDYGYGMLLTPLVPVPVQLLVALPVPVSSLLLSYENVVLLL